jgi:hypothetical protein
MVPLTLANQEMHKRWPLIASRLCLDAAGRMEQPGYAVGKWILRDADELPTDERVEGHDQWAGFFDWLHQRDLAEFGQPRNTYPTGSAGHRRWPTAAVAVPRQSAARTSSPEPVADHRCA